MYKYTNKQEIKSYIIKNRDGFVIYPADVKDFDEVINSTFALMNLCSISKSWFITPRISNFNGHKAILFIMMKSSDALKNSMVASFAVKNGFISLRAYLNMLQ